MEVDDQRPRRMPRKIKDKRPLSWESDDDDDDEKENDVERPRSRRMSDWDIREKRRRCMSLKPYSRQSFYSPSSDYFSDENSACKKKVDHDVAFFHKTLPEFPCSGTGCSERFTSIYDHEVHFRNVHTIFCNVCHMTFSAYNLLDYHIEENHEEYFGSEDRGFVFRFSCIADGCKETFINGTRRNEHLISVHKYPPNFNFPSTHGAGIIPKVPVPITDAEMAARVFTDRSHKLKPRHIALKTATSEIKQIPHRRPSNYIHMSEIKKVVGRSNRRREVTLVTMN